LHEDNAATARYLNKLAERDPTFFRNYDGISRQAVFSNAGVAMSGQPPQLIAYRGSVEAAGVKGGVDFLETAPERLWHWGPLPAFYQLVNVHMTDEYRLLGEYDATV
jgi:hypothetical protein